MTICFPTPEGHTPARRDPTEHYVLADPAQIAPQRQLDVLKQQGAGHGRSDLSAFLLAFAQHDQQHSRRLGRPNGMRHVRRHQHD